MQELVSIVVPIYNVEKYLDRCVKSIVSQTYKNLEIILVDDGSTDSSCDMCDDWATKDSRIKVVHKKNAGLGMARNTGIENATGDYICFFDSDDFVETDLVEKCLEEATLQNADVVLFGRKDIYDDGRIDERKNAGKKIIFNESEIKSNLLPGLFTYDMGYGVSAWSKIFKLKTIKDFGLSFKSEREVISEDAYFALEFFSKISTAVVLPYNFYFYYKRGNSLSRNYNPQRQKKNDIFLQKSLDYIKKENLPSEVENHLKARYHTLSLVCMKQIVSSDLSKKEKKAEFKKIFKNEVLRSTLDSEVIKLAIAPSRVFWTLFKLRFYHLCYLLLWIKADK